VGTRLRGTGQGFGLEFICFGLTGKGADAGLRGETGEGSGADLHVAWELTVPYHNKPFPNRISAVPQEPQLAPLLSLVPLKLTKLNPA